MMLKEKIINLLLPITWLLFFIFCLFIFASSSHASSYDDYYPLHQNNGSSYRFSQDMIDAIDNYYDADNNYIFAFYSNPWQGYDYIFVSWHPKTDAGQFYGEIKNDPYYFGLYSIGQINWHTQIYGYNSSNPSQPDIQSTNNQPFLNLEAPFYSYISNFRLYTNNTDNKLVVLNYGAGDDDNDNIYQGHATPPDPFEDPILAQGSNYTLPREVPEAPTINNYTWITYAPPSVDNSTLENLVESLVDIVKYNAGYVSTNISNEFNTLIDVIKGYGDFIVKTIQYYVGLVNDNIKNGFTNLYDNIVSLFEPALNGLSYLVEPFDGVAVSTAFTSTNFYNIKNQFISTFTTFDNAFDISEPDSFTLIFNVQNITPLYNLGVTSPVTVNLGDNFLPIRAALRTFLWILITFGSVFVVEHGLSNWIRGERKT